MATLKVTNIKNESFAGDQLYLKTDGKIGIGTTSPGHKLVISQTNSGGIAAIHLPVDESTILGPNANTYLKMGGNVVLGANGQIDLATSGASKITIKNDGKVLVGTTTSNSSDRFTIVDPGNAFMSLRSDAEADGNSQIIDFAVGTSNRSSSNLVSTITSAIPTGAGAGGTLKGYLAFSTNAGDNLSEKVRIHPDGMLTVGNDPSGAASYGGQMVVATTTGGILTCADTGSGERLQIEGGAGLPRIGTISSHNLAFFTNGIDKERFRITQGTAGTCTILFGGTTNNSNKSCALALNHYTFNTYNQIDMIKGTTSSGVNKIEIGGSDSSAGTSAATSIQLYTATNATTNNGTKRFNIDATGNVTVNTGNLVIGTSGKGIDFSATSDGSGTDSSELLDDYEEGTFTPSFSNGLTGSGYSYQHGAYTKVGRKVSWTIIIYISTGNASTNSNVINIDGFPYTCLNTSPYQGGGGHPFYQDVFYNSANGFSGIQIDNATQLRLYKASDGTYLTGSDVDGDRQVRLSGFYFTT